MKSAVGALMVGLIASSVLATDAPASLPAGVIFKGTKTTTGQPIAPPSAPLEVTAAISELPAGEIRPVHQHPFPRFVYVLSGRVEVTNIDTGKKEVFETGQFFVDPVGPWHQGKALDGKPAKLLTIDQTPPGKNNMVLRDPPPTP